MKKLILIALLMVGCNTPVPEPKSEPKFKYNDAVEVVKGFFRGCSGYVSSAFIEEVGIRYHAHLTKCPNADTVSIFFNAKEDFLKIIKEKK